MAPRTRHLLPDGTPKFTNALAHETSPYLLQHAHNPVDWRPWGPAAFDEARRRDVPVLLSVGYSTCHWCHVMEEESFEDEEIARAMNETFVCIKVDREERPDVDGVYMTCVQAMTGHGGWPMTVMMTDDGRPFFSGTYFPPRDGVRGARVGFLSLIGKVREAWAHDRARVVQSANEITAELRTYLTAPAATDVPGLDVVDRSVAFVARRYDPTWGGLSPAPKFPSALPVRLLFRHAARRGDDDGGARTMALHSLRKMAAGGMHDHVGGGFHRYSVDDKWLVPHFEKMLYDNALLVMGYLEAYQLTGAREHVDVVRDVLRWMRRELRTEDGAFTSATDADSLTPSGQREEGFFFTWTPDEIDALLEPADARLCKAAWGVTSHGNFEDSGRSILWWPREVSEVARREGVSDDDVRAAVARAIPILRAARAQRPAPLRDDKIIASWNGLALTALARAAFVLDDEECAADARALASFLLLRMRGPDGRMWRTYKDGQARHAGMLDDHAFVCAGLLDVYEATGEVRWLREALALAQVIEAHFVDDAAGGYFLAPDDGERLLAREKPHQDGAEPSGTSVHVATLLRLAQHTGDDAHRARASSAIASLGQILTRHPHALHELVPALMHLHALLHGGRDAPEIAVIRPDGDGPDGDGASEEGRALLRAVRETFVPHGVVVVVRARDVAAGGALSPLLRGRTAVDGRVTAYVCTTGTCSLPVTTAEAWRAQLATLR